MPTGLVTKVTLGNTFCSLRKRPIVTIVTSTYSNLQKDI